MTNRSAAREDTAGLIVASGSIVVVIISGIFATAFGFALPSSPWDAIAVLVLLPLGFAAPVATVLVIVVITVLIPWDVQNQFQIFGGGPDQRGALFADALLMLALLRAGWRIARGKIEFDLPMLVGTVVAAVAICATVWGIAGAAEMSAAVNEGRRVLFAAGTFLLTWPLLRDPASRRFLMRGLMVVGVVLAMSGLSQWLFKAGYSSAGDFGIRGGLASGQLQGGLYAYPVAVTLAWSAVITGAATSRPARALFGTILALNTICLLFTFERTLLVATVLACGFVAVIGGAEARRRAARWSGWGAVLLVFCAVIAETQARTAFERMALVGNLDSDNSYLHRVIESQVLSEQIASHPLLGSGFGSTVTWGVQNTFAPSTTPFADLGYHWLAWKAGLPAAAMAVMILLRAVFRRSRGIDSDQWHAVRIGSRGALFALVLINVMFGVFNTLGITAVIGLLAAICFSETTESDLPNITKGPNPTYQKPETDRDLAYIRTEDGR